MKEKTLVSQNNNNTLERIGGVLALVWLICPFLAIWIKPLRLHFALTAVWALILCFIIDCALKRRRTKVKTK